MTAPPPDGVEVHEDVPLARHTYLRLGGLARFFAIPEDVAQLERLLGCARARGSSTAARRGAAAHWASKWRTARAPRKLQEGYSRLESRSVTSVVMHAA